MMKCSEKVCEKEKETDQIPSTSSSNNNNSSSSEMDDRISVEFQTRRGEQMVRMTSTLVETVSINYEDFNESFLTCGTCLCTFDGGEHSPKLLPCSHTICVHCLGRIAANAAPPPTPSSLSLSSASTNSSGTSQPQPPPPTFRCPICRELITVPRGGVSALPPSFLVNQLLDLMASQRREVIPKCSTHSNQELLYCETCLCVFCCLCITSPHKNNTSGGEHTVIPFSIAIKRMSEILAYKANECISKLDEASDTVCNEMMSLDQAADRSCEVINSAFEEALQLLEKRRQSYISKVKEVASAKKENLRNQLGLIEKERAKVTETCEGEYQVEVGQITKRISDLSLQLESFASLGVPRDNAFLSCKALSDLLILETAITSEIRTSTTYPLHCTLRTEEKSILLCVGIEIELLLETRDYLNNPRKEGGDPVQVKILKPNGQSIPEGSIKFEDQDDGTYRILFTPREVGEYTIRVEIFGRSIKDDNFTLKISEHNNPLQIWGKSDLCQPVSATRSDLGDIFILDTGNARIVVLDSGINIKRVLQNETLQGRSCTGIAYCSQTDNILVVNWRSKTVTRINHQNGATISNFTYKDFVEPIGICSDKLGTLYVADNGARTIFIFDSNGSPQNHIKRDNFGLLGGLAVSSDGKRLIVADMSLFIINPAGGSKDDKEIKVTGKGRFGGVSVDSEGNIIATRTEKTRSFVQIFKENKLISTIDSLSSKLKRPSDLTIINSKNILVVDLGNDCIKIFRYK